MAMSHSQYQMARAGHLGGGFFPYGTGSNDMATQQIYPSTIGICSS